MKRQQIWWLAGVLATSLAIPLVATAQDASAEQAAKPQPEFQFYRVNFTVKELEDGKVANTRNYVTSMRAVAMPQRSGGIGIGAFGGGDNSASVRTGIKVPVSTRSSDQSAPTVTYMDVGVNIDCRLESAALRVSMDISSLAPAGPGQPEVAGNPIIRSIRGSATVPFILDKPILVTSVDDVTSKRQYQLEVTITKK